MTLDLDALEAVARAATPGPWEYRHESPSMNGENCTIRQSGVPGIRMSAHVYGFGTGMIEHIATFDPPTVLALIAHLREAEAKLPPCDGGCSYDSGPEETCSAHGRLPAEIWELVSRIAAERDVAQGQLGEAEHVIAQILDYDGPEAADMRDIALTYKPTNQEGS